MDAALSYLDVADAGKIGVRDGGSVLAPTKKRRRRAEPLEATPSMLRLLRYPVAGGDLSAHSDFECFTFVHQRVAGLEVQVDGVWRRLAAAADDAFCVLLAGDAVEYLSGGAVRAARHRVRSSAPTRFHRIVPRGGRRRRLGAARRRPVRVRRRASAADEHFGSAAPLTQQRHVRCRVERAEKERDGVVVNDGWHCSLGLLCARNSRRGLQRTTGAPMYCTDPPGPE